MRTLCILICFFACGGIVAHAGQFGPSAPGTKVLTLSQLTHRAKFRLLRPTPPAGYKLNQMMLAWVASEEVNDHKLPARQAACFFYIGSGQSRVFIIEIPTLSKALTIVNVDAIIGDGSFFKYTKVGCIIQSGCMAQTDYAIVTYGVPDKIVRQFRKSLQSSH